MADTQKKGIGGDLSPSARQIVDDKRIEGKKRLKEWFKLMKEVAVFDESTDALRQKAYSRGIISIIGAVILFIVNFVFIFLAAEGIVGGWIFFISVPAIILCIIGIVVFMLKGSRLKKFDLTNEFRITLLPFLQAISEDIRPGSRIKMSLDMSGATEEKVIKNEEIPPGRFKKLVETIYDDPWLKMEIVLAEGSRLLLNIESQYICHDRYWRNPRGKHKHKAKWKKLVKVTAGLAPNNEMINYDRDVIENISQSDKMRFAEKTGGELARLTRKFKFKAVNEAPEESVTTDDLLGMLFQLGSALRPAQTGR